MKNKRSFSASVIGLITSIALLAIMISDIVFTVINTIKAGTSIIDMLKNATNILQIAIAILALVSCCLNISLVKLFKDKKNKNVGGIVATILFSLTWLFTFVALVVINHTLMNIIEISVVGTLCLITNILYLIDFKRPKKKRKKPSKIVKEKEDEGRYTFKDKAQDLLLLIDLRDSKAITQEEYERLKEEILREKIIN